MSKEYTSYITEHVNNVQKAADWLYSHGIIPEHISLGLHDVSKYTPEEYEAYDNYFYGKRTEQVKKDFDYAWLHHIHANPHHWQHWVLVNDEDGTYGLEIPERHVYEMIADWWSFSHKTGNLREIFSWYDSHKKKMILHEKTRKLVEDILDKIKKELDKEEANENK